MKICFWNTMPSHYTQPFYKVLSKHVDLEVRYFEKVSKTRIDLGWNSYEYLPNNQKYVESLNEGIISLPDWKNRIHIISGYSSHFNKDLIKLFIKNNVKWAHWGERSGINLVKMIHFNYIMFDILYPLFIWVRGYKKYAKLINRNALGAFAIGGAAKKDFINWGVNEHKIEILPYSINALSKPNESPSWFNADNEKYFIYLGTLNKGKGIGILLKAFEKLNFRNRRNKWKLILAGKDESCGFYNKLSERYKISDKVIFTGPIKVGEINKHIYYADVFVLPTLFDGWGVVINEAISIGKPVISTNQAGASMHLIKNGKNGFIVNAKDDLTFKNAMQSFIDNPDLISAYGENSFKIFQEYSPESNSIRFIDAINKWI